MKEISYKDFVINPITSIGKDWMLITAGSIDKYNTMTASWGHIGALWGENLDGKGSVVIYVRPSRYTDSFIDNNEYFSLSLFDESYHKDLAYLGSHSGRDEDKVSKTSLSPDEDKDKHVTYFPDAKVVLICRKVYKGKINKEGFIDKTIIDKWYMDNDLHNVYIGKIEKILVQGSGK